MSTKTIFSFSNYRDYLRSEFPGSGNNRGRRMLLAKYLRCQTSYLSQILTDRAHLSLEHAIVTSKFLDHQDDEKEYFMLLIQKEKSGNASLNQYFLDKIQHIKTEREEIAKRIPVGATLDLKFKQTYYSSWHYLAIHILSALPAFNTAEAMAKKLKLERENVEEALRFLVKHGLVIMEKGYYSIGAPWIHLARGDAMLSRHHQNWRLKAIQAIEFESKTDLHYSVLLGISKQDQKFLKEKILKLMEDFTPIIKASKEEIPVAFAIDFYEL